MIVMSTAGVPIEVLRSLGANRWALPVMALLSREGGARFAAIARRLAISPHSLTRCLDHLRDCGWVVPNSGHGHPLRPDYLPSDAGRAVGALCERVMDERERLELGAADLSRWSLPLVASLSPEGSRFCELQERLAPVTPRALSQTLQGMIGQQLVTRRLEDRFPPLPLYGLSPRARDLAAALAG